MAKNPETTEDPQPDKEIIDTAPLEPMLDTLKKPEFKPIEMNFFSHQTRKSTRLIGNTLEDNTIQARNEWYSYDFVSIIYISTVEVDAIGYSDTDEIEFSYIDPFTQITRTFSSSKFDGSKFRITVNRFARGFGIKPPVKWLASPRVTAINVKGLEPFEFTELIQTFDNLAAFRDKIRLESDQYVSSANEAIEQLEARNQEIESHNETIAELDKKIAEQSNMLGKLHEEQEALQKNIENANSSISEKQGTVTQIEDMIEKKSEERKKLNSEVTQAEARLSTLRGDIHLFPSEISGYVKSGARNIWAYLALSLIPFGLMIAVTVKLFANSENLLNIFMHNPQIPIVDYLISRIPYAVVSVAILTVCYTLLHRLFAEIITTNRRKQDLYKISIVATDVSFASEKGLGLTPEQMYDLRTATKMELLKEHLRRHLHEDYTYKWRL